MVAWSGSSLERNRPRQLQQVSVQGSTVTVSEALAASLSSAPVFYRLSAYPGPVAKANRRTTRLFTMCPALSYEFGASLVEVILHGPDQLRARCLALLLHIAAVLHLQPPTLPDTTTLPTRPPPKTASSPGGCGTFRLSRACHHTSREIRRWLFSLLTLAEADRRNPSCFPSSVANDSCAATVPAIFADGFYVATGKIQHFRDLGRLQPLPGSHDQHQPGVSANFLALLDITLQHWFGGGHPGEWFRRLLQLTWCAISAGVTDRWSGASPPAKPCMRCSSIRSRPHVPVQLQKNLLRQFLATA